MRSLSRSTIEKFPRPQMAIRHVNEDVRRLPYQSSEPRDVAAWHHPAHCAKRCSWSGTVAVRENRVPVIEPHTRVERYAPTVGELVWRCTRLQAPPGLRKSLIAAVDPASRPIGRLRPTARRFQSKRSRVSVWTASIRPTRAPDMPRQFVLQSTDPLR